MRALDKADEAARQIGDAATSAVNETAHLASDFWNAVEGFVVLLAIIGFIVLAVWFISHALKDKSDRWFKEAEDEMRRRGKL